jgi:hypothetical protein
MTYRALRRPSRLPVPDRCGVSFWDYQPYQPYQPRWLGTCAEFHAAQIKHVSND